MTSYCTECGGRTNSKLVNDMAVCQECGRDKEDEYD